MRKYLTGAVVAAGLISTPTLAAELKIDDLIVAKTIPAAAASNAELPHVPRSQTVCFWKTNPGLDSPDAYAYARGGPQISPENAAGRSLPASTWSLVVGLRLQGRGRIRLTGAGVDAPLSIDTGYLSGSEDLARVAAAAEMAREIGNQQALAGGRVEEFPPGKLSRTELETYLRRGVGTFWHQCGTARSGKDASTSVVDGRLRVHGLDGLRVADASIFPRVTSGNTMAPSVLVGELAARFINGGLR